MAEQIQLTKAQILTDLRFAIQSPDLEDLSSRYQPSSGWYQAFWLAIKPFIKDQFNETEQVPTRLGLYFEWLWGQALQAHPEYRLVTQNLQIFENGNTLGSLDFIVEHLPSKQLEHWELACKFYLAFHWKNHWYWLGPNLNDAWQLKKAKMLTHQIAISDTEAAHQTYQAKALDAPKVRRILVKGKLFWPEKEPNKACYWHTYSRQLELGNKGVIQPKQCWLGEKYASDKALATGEALTRATMLLDQGNQKFVVPDNWQLQAQKKAAELARSTA